MGNTEPEWERKQMVHNALTKLNLSLFASPLLVFGIIYWFLENGTAFSKSIVVGFALLAALLNLLFLFWLIKKVKGMGGTSE